MSFELFLCCYQDGKPSGIDESRLRAAFGDALISENTEFRYWHLEYGSEINSCDVYITRLENDSSQVTGLTVSRPVAEEGLWQSLFRIMQLGNVILFFPGGRSPLIANERAIRHFPDEMLEALGAPEIIESSHNIVAAIER
jgi:hypothetical protein